MMTRFREVALHLFKTKSPDHLLAEAAAPERQLKRALGALDLTCVGIGAVIGAGIFALAGTAAAGEQIEASLWKTPVLNFVQSWATGAPLVFGRPGAGPGVMLSFIVAGVACGFAAFCYAELASMIPVAGSAYTYSYATLGEIIAWIIGWDLILEYAVGNMAVAVGWAGYLKAQLAQFHFILPDAWSSPVWAAGKWTGAYFNLPGFLVVFVLTILLVRGVRESAETNNIMVAVKIGAIVVFLIVG